MIFLCEPEIEFRDEDKKHLFEFKIGKEEVDCFENDGTYTYKLISIIIKSKDGYDYYNRKLDEKMFSKNDGDIKDNGEEGYSLEKIEEMSGNPVALYYYSDRKKIEKNQKNARDKIINNSNENVYQKNEDEQKKIDNNSTSTSTS